MASTKHFCFPHTISGRIKCKNDNKLGRRGMVRIHPKKYETEKKMLSHDAYDNSVCIGQSFNGGKSREQ